MRVLGRSLPAFQVCGTTGFVAAVVWGLLGTRAAGLSVAVIALLALSSAATFLALAYVTRVILGEERLVYYHQEVAIVAVAALVLLALGRPVLPYLDVTLLGIGTFLAFGRLGCLLGGCCHGRPHRYGVTYRPEHAEAGFPRHLVGVRLFPIQLVEAAWVALTVAVGMALVLGGAAPGEALAWYSIAYGAARIALELFRGDAERPYWLGVSEAQWTTVVLMLAVSGLELAGVLPFHAWHLAVTAAAAGTVLFLAARRDGDARLLSARHLHEIAELVRLAAEGTGEDDLRIGETSMGLRVSVSHGAGSDGLHVALSSNEGPLSPAQAARIADLIGHLHDCHASVRPSPGQAGLFHVSTSARVEHAV